MTTHEPIIRVENLSKQFLEVKALVDVSLRIHPGRIVGLVGANGGGKSTLLRTIIQDSGRTILISSHILSDIEKVIDHVLILDRGRVLRDTGLDELREEFSKICLTSLNGPLPETLPFDGILACERTHTEALLTLQSVSRSTQDRLAEQLHCALEPLPLSFEEIYHLVVERESQAPKVEP